MKKIILGLLILGVAGFSVFSYRNYSKCEKVDFSTIIGKEYIYTENNLKTDITLTFLDDRIAGFDGVNRYFAGYKIEEGKITFSPIGSTMMAGPEDKMQLARTYLNLLNNVDKVETYKAKLILITKDNQTLKFVENTEPIQLNNPEMVGPTQPVVNTTNTVAPIVEETQPQINEDSMEMDSSFNTDTSETENTNSIM